MWECQKCGNCCRVAGLVANGILPIENGKCVHFDEQENECKIYENRPEVCRVKEKDKEFIWKYCDMMKNYLKKVGD